MMLRLLQLYVFLLPFEMLWLELFGVDTILKPYRLVGLAIIGLKIVGTFNPRTRVRIDVFDRVFLAIFTWGLLAAVFWYVLSGSGNLSWATSDSILIFFAFAVYIVLKSETRQFATVEKLLDSFLLGTLVSIVSYAGFFGSITADRFQAFYDNPNRLAVAVTACLVLIVARFLFGRVRRRGVDYLWHGGLFLFLSFVLFFTGSKGALLGFAFSLMAFAIPLMVRSKQTGSLNLGRVVAILPVVVAAGLVISAAFTEYEDSTAVQRYQIGSGRTSNSAGSRLDIWESAWNVAQDHYFLGVGTAQYRFYHRDYVSRLDNLRSPKIAEADLGTHSDYLNLLTSFGIVCTALYAWMLLLIYRGLTFGLGRLKERDFYPMAAYLPVLVFLVVNAATHIMMGSPDYWFFMALITGAVAPTLARGRPTGGRPGRPAGPERPARPGRPGFQQARRRQQLEELRRLEQRRQTGRRQRPPRSSGS